VKAVQAIFDNEPGLLQKFKDKNLEIAVVKSNVAEYPGIDPEARPRGWSAGYRLKDVPAVFFEDRVLRCDKQRR
jgi:hypothetical protein